MKHLISTAPEEGNATAQLVPLNELPVEDSPVFQAECQRLLETVAEKYVWSAQQSGMVLRRNPLKQTYRDYEFDRIARVHYSFPYRRHSGRRKLWYPSVSEMLGRLEEEEELPLLVIERLDFLPGREEVTEDEDGSIALNLWRQPPWKELAGADKPALFLDHLAYLFSGDEVAIADSD
jgi:hypothetical protein